MRNLSIVTIDTIDMENYNDENYNHRPGDLVGEPLPLSDYGNYLQFPPELTPEQEPEPAPAPTPELKLFDMHSFVRCQERQLQRLQKDQSKRILDYRQLRHKLATDTNDMQKQIDEIRAELQTMSEKTAQMEEMRKRVMHCEEQNVQMQIHNDSEFEVLRGVMQHVCGRIERMEELQFVERNYGVQQQLQLEQQQLQQRDLHHQQLQQHQQQQEHEIDQESQQMVEHPSLRSQVSAETQTQRPRAYSRRTRTTARSVCPRCHKDLAKNYVKKHLRFNRCGRPYC